MKFKLTFFILTLLALIPQLSLAATQDLTYDNPTNQVNISYDVLNRILSKNSTSINITYNYDNQYEGTLANITFSNSTYKYEYDDRLRVTKETRTIDGIQFEKNSYYDSMDRLVKQVLNPGDDVDYYYNNQSKLSSLLGFINSTFYNAFDNTLNRTYANTRVTQFGYDNNTGRLTQIRTGSIQQLDYSYDNSGNIVSLNDSINNIGQRLVSWLFNTGVESISSSQNVNLNTSEGVFIVIETNYSAGGVYGTNVTINSTLFKDTSTGISVT